MRDESSFVFSGPFRDVIPAYIQHKRAIGYKVAASELYRLMELDRFFQERGVTVSYTHLTLPTILLV